MNPIEIIAERSYQVSFSDSWDTRLKELIGTRGFIILTQAVLAERVTAHFAVEDVVILPEGESQKSLASYSKLLEVLAARNLDRNALIIGIGGGATTDLAGFLAATYLRGVEWVAVPTSVAGMVDAAIGGKTGINLDSGKNLAGVFYSPAEVIVSLDWLTTLTQRDVRAGLSESLKCGFIADPQIIALFKKGYEKNLEEIIHRSIAVKASIVSKDFRESYERESLNYGHTLGHAIEKDSNYGLRHGEAISIGMIFAAELSRIQNGLADEVVGDHYELLEVLELPVTYKRDSWPSLLQFMSRDKKRKTRSIRFVTLIEPGGTSRSEFSSELLETIYKDKIAR